MVRFRQLLLVLIVLSAAMYYINVEYRPVDLLHYVKDHPKSIFAMAAVDYAIGMIYFVRDEHLIAIEAFNQLLQDYPDSSFKEDALLRLGESYEDMHKWQEARDVYQQYLQLFSGSKSAEIVTKKYERIRYN